MEISEYQTNVLSINDFASVRYSYLESPHQIIERAQLAIADVESTWRAHGVIVIRDPNGQGLWLFGTLGRVESILRSSTTLSENLIQVEDQVLVIREEGEYKPRTLLTAPRSPPAHSTTVMGSASSSTSIPDATRLGPPQSFASPHNSTPAPFTQGAAISTPLIDTGGSSTDPVAVYGKIHELFLSAILASLNYGLCKLTGCIPLNARSLVMPHQHSTEKESEASLLGTESCNNHSSIITLDVHMTSLDTLVLKASSQPATGLSCLQSHIFSAGLPDTANGRLVFLAPSGRLAKFQGMSKDGDSGTHVLGSHDTSDDLEAASSPPAATFARRWQQAFTDWLLKKGLSPSALESTSWVMMQMPQYDAVVPHNSAEDEIADEDGWSTLLWPTFLCFLHVSPRSIHHIKSDSSDDYDPMAFAESWFASSSERDVTLSKRQREREAVESALKAQSDLATTISPLSNEFIRPVRRASNAGAVYPTPPDGVQHAAGITPSFDEIPSTPGPLMRPPTSLEVIDPMTSSKDGIEGPEIAEDSTWESSAAKKDLTASGLEFNDENLFGDMDGDLFGETNITDADFSFFDEPDALSHQEKHENHDTEDATESDQPSIEEHSVLASTNSVPFKSISSEDTKIAAPATDPPGEVETETTSTAISDNQTTNLDTAPEIDIFTNKLVSPPPISTDKDVSAPLSPETVFKRLIEMNNGEMSGTNSFGGVKFDPSLSSFSQKYGTHGRFDSPASPRSSLRKSSINLPKTEYLSRRQKGRSVKDVIHTPLPKTPLSQSLLNLPNDDQSDADSSDSYDGSSGSSVQGEDIYSPGRSTFTPTHNAKRKRPLDEEDEEHENSEMASSFQDLNVAHEKSPPEDTLEIFDPADLDPDPAEWSLARYFASPEPYRRTAYFSDADYIAMAQMLADQALSMTVQLPPITDRNIAGEVQLNVDRSCEEDRIHENLLTVAKTFFDQVKQCTTAAYMEIQDTKTVAQVHRLPPRPTPNPRGVQGVDAPRAIFALPPPHLEVCRAESRLSILPSAIPFWDSLGLGPSKGPKIVSAICVCPSGKGMAENLEAFLEHIGNAYEASHLGVHERFGDALFTYDFSPSDLGSHASLLATGRSTLSAIQEVAARVGKALLTDPVEDKNIVVYYVFDSSVPEVLLHICSAFHDLFNIYRDALAVGKTSVKNELVLQLVPIEFVGSKTSLVIPTPASYTRLALEVYDRCTDLNTGNASPSILLEQPLPRIIDFKLTPNPSASLMQENSVMHIAYAQSLDDRWITTAWTDNIGDLQLTASYCLGRKDEPLTTTFASVAEEIWDTTLEIISTRKVNWRIIIARCGVMTPPEVDFWKALASTETNAQVSMTLVTIDTNPSLHLLPPQISLPPSTLSTQSATYTTPVSTPSASIVSPEQSGNASTPARDGAPVNAATPSESQPELKTEADAILIDLTEQSWGAVLSHSLNNSNSLLELNPALVSGYLIKRGGIAVEDAPVVMEVNIVHSEVNPRVYEALLREILSFYRGLATLARARGVVDPVKDGRPWHIAAAEKGVNMLYMLM
ncbi:MAG: mediator of RNA polymerase II transcription subunit 13 [Claussenomyces sp. TS43310]|nr:MAG: mediator of RNA polymerase II transcription subunit 13 [Claussenomyces sp. TS43310]